MMRFELGNSHIELYNAMLKVIYSSNNPSGMKDKLVELCPSFLQPLPHHYDCLYVPYKDDIDVRYSFLFGETAVNPIMNDKFKIKETIWNHNLIYVIINVVCIVLALMSLIFLEPNMIIVYIVASFMISTITIHLFNRYMAYRKFKQISNKIVDYHHRLSLVHFKTTKPDMLYTICELERKFGIE